MTPSQETGKKSGVGSNKRKRSPNGSVERTVSTRVKTSRGALPDTVAFSGLGGAGSSIMPAKTKSKGAPTAAIETVNQCELSVFLLNNTLLFNYLTL
jgi:hypothetical protein